MPIYTFRCSDCGIEADHLRRLAQRRTPAVCLECGGTAERAVESPQGHRTGFIPGAIMRNIRTGERVNADGLINKTAPRKKADP